MQKYAFQKKKTFQPFRPLAIPGHFMSGEQSFKSGILTFNAGLILFSMIIICRAFLKIQSFKQNEARAKNVDAAYN